MREKPLSTMSDPTSPGGVSASRAKIFGRGTITLRTGMSVNSKTLWMISISVWSRTPCWRPSRTRCLISSSDTKVRGPASLMPRTRSTSRVDAATSPTTQREPRAMQPEGPGHDEGDRLRVAQRDRLRDSSPRTSSTYTMARPTIALASTAAGRKRESPVAGRAGSM